MGVAESIKVVFAFVKLMSNNQTIKVNIIKKPNNFKNVIKKDYCICVVSVL